MTVYRDPIYIDKGILAPIANRWGIEVDREVEVTARDLTNKKGGFEGKTSIGGIASAGLNLGGGTEAEISQKRIIQAHPGAALNELIDILYRDNELLNLEDEAIRKSSLVEIEGDWEISPITEIGSMMGSLIQMMTTDPNIMHSKEVPLELAANLVLPNSISNRKIVLTKIKESEEEQTIIALLDSDLLVGNYSEDDLEDDKTVLGLVETFKPENGIYSLERYFSGGMARTLRRKMKPEKIYESLGTLYDGDFSEEDLKISGPLVVVKVVAVYP